MRFRDRYWVDRLRRRVARWTSGNIEAVVFRLERDGTVRRWANSVPLALLGVASVPLAVGLTLQFEGPFCLAGGGACEPANVVGTWLTLAVWVAAAAVLSLRQWAVVRVNSRTERAVAGDLAAIRGVAEQVDVDLGKAQDVLRHVTDQLNLVQEESVQMQKKLTSEIRKTADLAARMREDTSKIETLIDRGNETARAVADVTTLNGSILQKMNDGAEMAAVLQYRIETGFTGLRDLAAISPEAQMMHPFGDIYARCTRVFRDAYLRPEGDQDEAYRRCIRYAMGGVLRAARRWERELSPYDANGTRYAANIMVFHDKRSVAEEEALGLLRRVSFAGPAPSLDEASGFLDLREELAVWLESSDDGPDPIGPLVLLAPHPEAAYQWERDPDLPWRALPGAPMAFGLGEVHQWQDTSRLSAWCRDEGDFPADVPGELADYFAGGRGADIGSFLSFYLDWDLSEDPFGPSGPQEAVADAYRPLGVLNVHSNNRSLLAGQSGPLFGRAIRPLRLMINHALADLLRATP